MNGTIKLTDCQAATMDKLIHALPADLSLTGNVNFGGTLMGNGEILSRGNPAGTLEALENRGLLRIVRQGLGGTADFVRLTSGDDRNRRMAVVTADRPSPSRKTWRITIGDVEGRVFGRVSGRTIVPGGNVDVPQRAMTSVVMTLRAFGWTIA